MAARAKTIAFSENPAVRLFALAVLAAAMLTAVIMLATSAKAGSAFDGAWRVTIITQSGNCDPAYSYPVKVESGRVSYSGDGSFDISGHVGDAGAVSNWGGALAMSTLSVIPAFILFFSLQRYFVQGITTSGLKG